MIAHDSTQGVITCKNRDTNGIKSFLWCNPREERRGEEEKRRGEKRGLKREREGEREGKTEGG